MCVALNTTGRTRHVNALLNVWSKYIDMLRAAHVLNYGKPQEPLFYGILCHLSSLFRLMHIAPRFA